MDQGRGQYRSNLARWSRLPLARASSISAIIHQDEPAKQSRLPQIATSHTRKSSLRPLGESNSASIKQSFGWSGVISPRSASPQKDYGSLTTTPPSTRAEADVVNNDGDENSTLR